MRVFFAGGVGEHGRNCFLVEAQTCAFLVDCGVMAGSNAPYPALTRPQIAGLRYVFLTHSHDDHTGALAWLAGQGFSGTVVATVATLSQLAVTPARTRALEAFAPPSGLSLRWGRAGHCVGSVWYAFTESGPPEKQLFFSGDYTEHSLVYPADPVRGLYADLAVLDSAYGSEPRADDAMRQDFLTAVQPFVKAGQPVLFPVPKFGRGQELLLLLHRQWSEVPLYGDAHFRQQTELLARDTRWVSPQARAFLRQVAVQPLGDLPPECGFCFVSGPQLGTADALRLAEQTAERGGVILTGEIDKGSGAWQLFHAGQARFARVPVHCSDVTRLALQEQNHFARVVAYHTAQRPCIARVIEW